MFTSRGVPMAFFSLVLLVLVSTPLLAADPGDPLIHGANSVVNDQKAGSLLFFNIYTSSTANPAAQNTSLSITNTSDSQAAFVHVFFVDGNTCSVADRYFCLTRLQTLTFYAHEQDPGVTGYIVAYTVDFGGLPKRFNYLIGVENVKFSTGHADFLAAESFAKLTDANILSADGSLALLIFDGLVLSGSYSLPPRVVALDNIPSRLDGNDTLLIVNAIGGNLTSFATTGGNVFGILYDEAEQSYSFTFLLGCQLRASLTDAFPRVTPRFTRVIPQGSVGWMKIWSTVGVPLLGAMINSNPGAAVGGGFNGGHNLHKLTFSVTTYIVPIFPPNC